MNIEIKLDGKTFVNADFSFGALLQAWETVEPMEGLPEAQSTPITVDQAKQLLSRISPKSVAFLRRIAENGGYVTWPEMEEIFDIEDWPEYSGSYGKGITRALRHITNGKYDTLVHWNDDDAAWATKDWADGRVYVDGEALKSLRTAFGL